MLSWIKKIYIVVIIISFSINGLAQGSTSLGVNFGVNQFIFPKQEGFSNDFSYNTGVLFRHNVSQHVRLGIGFQFLAKRYHIDTGISNPSAYNIVRINIELRYLSIPITFDYMFSLSNKFYAGPMAGFTLNKLIYDNNEFVHRDGSKYSYNSECSYKSSLSLNIGFILGYNLNEKFMLEFEAAYITQLTNTTSNNRCYDGSNAIFLNLSFVSKIN